MFNSFLGFLFKALPAGEVHAHGGGGGKRGKSSRVGGGGATPKTDAKKQALVKKQSQMALADPKNYRKNTSATSRNIIRNFQANKQTTQKDYSKAIAKSISRNRKGTSSKQSKEDMLNRSIARLRSRLGNAPTNKRVKL